MYFDFFQICLTHYWCHIVLYTSKLCCPHKLVGSDVSLLQLLCNKFWSM